MPPGDQTNLEFANRIFRKLTMATPTSSVFEFKEVVTVSGVSSADAAALKTWNSGGRPDLSWQGLHLSKGHRVLSLIKDGKTGESTAEIGLPWSAEEFVSEALQCDHPFDRRVRVRCAPCGGQGHGLHR